MSTRPHAGYLTNDLTGLGLIDLGLDAGQIGTWDAIMTRTWRGYGVEVEVREDTADVTLRLFGWGDLYGGEDTYRHGHLAQTVFPAEWPTALLLATIAAAVAANVETALIPA
ncbi:hypothetical protein [Planomonospora algeriensis]